MVPAESFSDRALKYGRNVIAISSVILILALVPGIDVEHFEAFGFKIRAGGEFWAWCMLCTVLAYYFGMFVFTWRVDFQVGAHESLVEFNTPKYPTTDTEQLARVKEGAERLTTCRFYLDLAFPALMFVFAFIAAVVNIVKTWPVDSVGS